MEGEGGDDLAVEIGGATRGGAEGGRVSGPGSGKENERVGNGGDASPRASCASGEDSRPSADGAGELSVEGEASAVTSGSRGAKKPEVSVQAKSNERKSEAKRNGPVAAGLKKQKPGLSQSLSFPAKGILAAGLRRSTDQVKSTKADAKASRPAGSEVSSSISNGGPAAENTNSASVDGGRMSSAAKSSSANATATRPSSDKPRVQDHILKSSTELLQSKNDDDVHSTTSSTAPHSSAVPLKSNGPCFASRLDERAGKRKEFFLKLEEKIHAIEMEKTNLQAMSKESQEAEIKQLRKSLTFKATPMPSFYKEPGPPKVELKKIPTTRPVSPKFGRHKPSSTGKDAASEVAVPSRQLRFSLDSSRANKGADNISADNLDSKSSVRRSLPRLPGRKVVPSKVEAKALGQKVKVPEAEEKVVPTTIEVDDDVSKNVELARTASDARIDSDNVSNTVEDDATKFNSQRPEMASKEITARG